MGDNAEFDYIVVGSGSGGAAVAARLSEAGRSVLLLEAGPDYTNPWMSLPIAFGRVLLNPRYAWHFETEPEAGLMGRRISALRGKVLGGSSSVNGLIYVRGFPSDYALWRQMGAEGWSYEDVAPYFRKSQRWAKGGDEYHGDEGGVGVEIARWVNPLTDAFLEAAETVGIPRNPDFFRSDGIGLGYYPLTTWKGRRSSVAVAYLKRARKRPNLKILTDALVTKIVFSGRQATGVRYERGQQEFTARARHEIVLSAGSFATPQLLQLSGVGPGHLLQEHGIEVVSELSGVGENLMDHITTKRAYTTGSRYTFNAMMSSIVTQGMAGLRYMASRSGPLAIGAAMAGGYARTDEAEEDPDIQIFYMPFEAGDYSGKLPSTSSYQIAFYQNRPESRGHVRITTPDAHVPPAISPNYFSAEKDIRTVVKGMRLIGKIGAAGPLAGLGAKEIEPALDRETDENLIQYARETSSTGYHHVGTCRMGQDDRSVVDPALRVRGVSRLRIADGSVMPMILSANTNAACIMIGEKCADLILSEG